MKFTRRSYRVLLLIGIAGFLFLCFQFFSFQVLSLSGRQDHRKLGQTGHQARVLDDKVIEPVMDRKPLDKHGYKHDENVHVAQQNYSKKTGK